MKVVVTGAAGRLGPALLRAATAAYGKPAVVALTHDALDVSDDAAVKTAVVRTRPEAILNAAAYTDVDGAEDAAETALSVNAFGVRALAEAAADVGATLVHYSTDFVFDGTKGAPYVETDDPNPLAVYAASKLLGEWFAEGATRYVLRVESLFGGARGGTVDRMADALLAGREVHAFTDRVVSPTSVDDVAAATIKLLDALPAPGLYHCTSTGHARWIDIAYELARQLNVASPDIRPTTLEEMALRAPRPKYCALSSDKLAATGITMPTWQDAIARYARSRLST